MIGIPDAQIHSACLILPLPGESIGMMVSSVPITWGTQQPLDHPGHQRPDDLGHNRGADALGSAVDLKSVARKDRLQTVQR